MFGEALPGSVRYQGLLSGHRLVRAAFGVSQMAQIESTARLSGHTADANPSDGWSALTAEGLSKCLTKQHWN